jgi:LysR family transcriptional regulator, nitrogen assimilation regulatory protein
MVDLKRLGFFIQIAADGSLSKASKTLHIAQPALSRQVHNLEEYLGFKLFVRTSRGMPLTREGKLLHNAIVGPLRDLELAVQNMRSFMSRIEVDFGIGFHPGLGPTLAMSLVQRLRNDFPAIKFRIVEGPSDSQIDWLKRGVIDFALLDFPISDPQLADRLLASEDLLLMSAAGHGEGQVSFNDLPTLPLVLPCLHHGVRKVIDEAADKARLSLNVQFEADSLPLVTELVRDGELHTLLPRSLAQNIATLSDFSLRAVTGLELKAGIYLATRNYGQIEGSVISKLDSTIEDLVIDLVK